MPRGVADIPELRLEVLQGFIEKWTAPPELVFSTIFSASNAPSDTIKWESFEGTRGMTPFKPPGGKTPQTYPSGVAEHNAKPAFWGEMMYFDEEFLNQLRKRGTDMQYDDASGRLARELAGLVNRCRRRREWMFAKMIVDGTVEYFAATGLKFSVDYGIPTDHKVTLGAAYAWDDGTSRDILGNIIDAKKKISDDCGAKPDVAICNSTVLKYLAQDPTIQTLLQKSTFGNGDLFSGAKNPIVGVNPNIIAFLLDIPRLIITDEKYEVRANLTSAVTASSTTSFTVDNIADFEAGATIRFVDVSAGTYEEETISSVTAETSTIVVATAPSTSYKAGEDIVMMRKGFVADDKFVLMATRVEGQQIAEYKRAPFGLDRHYDLKIDRKEEWDPEGIYIRVQDKGLPILYQRDAIYILDVT